MPRVVKGLLMIGLLVGIGWVSVRVRVEGRTPYGHFQAAGGERALEEGWAWVRSGLEAGARSLGRRAGTAYEAATDWVGATLDGMVELLWSGEPDATPSGPKPRAGRSRPDPAPTTPAGRAIPRPAEPLVQTGPRARDRVDRLEAASGAEHALRPAEKSRTRIDARVDPDEKAALDALLARP